MAEIRREKTAEQEQLFLGGDLTIASMKDVKTALQDAIRNASSVAVYLEHVRNLDVAFLQILCSAHRTAADENKPFSIYGELDRFKLLLEAGGFQRHIGCCDSSRHPCLWLCNKGETESRTAGSRTL